MKKQDNIDKKQAVSRSVSSELLGACLDILQDFSETPCDVCGDEGYTLPCLRCNKPVCPDHRDDLDYCEEHRST